MNFTLNSYRRNRNLFVLRKYDIVEVNNYFDPLHRFSIMLY